VACEVSLGSGSESQETSSLFVDILNFFEVFWDGYCKYDLEIDIWESGDGKLIPFFLTGVVTLCECWICASDLSERPASQTDRPS